MSCDKPPLPLSYFWRWVLPPWQKVRSWVPKIPDGVRFVSSFRLIGNNHHHADLSVFFRIFVLIHCFLLLYTSWFLWAWFGDMRILFPAMSILILPNCAGDEWTWARRPSQMSGKTCQCFNIQSSYTIYKTGFFSPPTEWMCKMAG